MDRRVIYVSSANRTSGTPDDFTIVDTGDRYTSVPLSIKVKSVTIPYTWYNMTSSNNSFMFTGMSSGPHSFTIPPGNYTGATLATELAKQLNIAVGGGSCSGGYTVVYDPTTGKFTIASTTENFSINFTIPNNMAQILGFALVVTPSAASHTSTTAASLLTDFYVWVCTDLIAGVDNGIANWTGNPPDTEQMGIVACVPIKQCFGSLLHYEVPTEYPFYTIVNSAFATETTGRSSRYFLRLPSGAPFSLNGNNWAMEIILDFNQP